MMMQKKRRLAHEINVVPYIDVMLVLLVIFMITAPLLTQGVEVDLPDAPSEALEYDAENEPIVMSIDAAGRYYLNRGEDPKAPLDDASVSSIVSKILKYKPQTAVVVEGDAAVPYARVMYAMSLLQSAGAKKLGFATESPE
jgi:biopolymer transport protein TolR